MTFNELYSELWLDISPNISDDSVLDKRLLKKFINTTRSLFVRNELNKSSRSVDVALLQNLGVIEMEPINSFSPIELDISKTILRSKRTIPKPVELHTKVAFTRIGSKDISTNKFKIIDYRDVPYSGKGKFNKEFIYVFYLDDYIYAIGDRHNLQFKGLLYINVIGVFEDPEEASKFAKTSTDQCYTDDENYPLSGYLWKYIKKEILSTDLRQFYIPLEDDKNNADNDINKLDGDK